ncbi:hypothetical protein M2347_000177 [Chryseobacterium sp. H1D6B]|uniref:microviridin/marinostatin family tricyclic proteinase inhibitor n=1 Tax=Chryseobacterium sp. H1D6B TaxID=2940588 RepID=UPI0015C7BA03|nr:microviridin/marinostatin family tricyclic proteinase inhibitor [Chryseobacterium sp. H1D6B]MDH6250450.1 hypothetical protein [Chryseobacterium sp. H1D6B]
MKDSNSKKKPFFASFLEKQLKDPQKVKGGVATSPIQDAITSVNKDDVTGPGGDQVTMKYPSDSDEGGYEV